MTRYDAYKFVHVSAAIVWIGGGVMAQILAARATSTRDDQYFARLFQDVGFLANRLFIPSSLTVVAMGLLMVIDGPWSFKPLWVVLGLAGYVATFVTGAFVLGPRSERAAERYDEAGLMTPDIAAEMRRVLLLVRVDTVALFLVVADMVIKPTGDDVGVLVAMAAIFVAGIAATVAAIRGVEPVSASA